MGSLSLLQRFFQTQDSNQLVSPMLQADSLSTELSEERGNPYHMWLHCQRQQNHISSSCLFLGFQSSKQAKLREGGQNHEDTDSPKYLRHLHYSNSSTNRSRGSQFRPHAHAEHFQQIQGSLSCPGKTTEEAMHTCVVQVRKWRFVVAYK